MYSGTTVGKKSGHLVGVHQRIDRVARRHLTPLLKSNVTFPSISQILHFEGNNGPDGIKRKSPSKDEPWHYIDPLKPDDRSLLEMIRDHQVNLGKAVKSENQERAAFEAAWLAHAIVDGLTPAHHFPLADKIEELFGIPHHERLTVKDKNVIKGASRRDTVSKNWEYWGSKGIFTNHFMFELGVATSILGKNFGKVSITKKDLADLKKNGYEKTFQNILVQVIDLKTYELYAQKGWSWALARTVREQLVPLIVKGVTLGWYASVVEEKK